MLRIANAKEARKTRVFDSLFEEKHVKRVLFDTTMHEHLMILADSCVKFNGF